MSFFSRWYSQQTFVKINDTQAMDIMVSGTAGFPTLPATPELRKKVINKAGEIYHCNIKLPLSTVTTGFGLPEDGPLTIEAYSNAIINTGETGPTPVQVTADLFQHVSTTNLDPGGTSQIGSGFLMELSFEGQYTGTKYVGNGIGSTEQEARMEAVIDIFQQLKDEDKFVLDPNSPYATTEKITYNDISFDEPEWEILDAGEVTLIPIELDDIGIESIDNIGQLDTGEKLWMAVAEYKPENVGVQQFIEGILEADGVDGGYIIQIFADGTVKIGDQIWASGMELPEKPAAAFIDMEDGKVSLGGRGYTEQEAINNAKSNLLEFLGKTDYYYKDETPEEQKGQWTVNATYQGVYTTTEYSAGGAGATKKEAQAAAAANVLSQITGDDRYKIGLYSEDADAPPPEEEFRDELFQALEKQFVDFEGEKIPKVAQYLSGPTPGLELPELDRKLRAGEGKNLLNYIMHNSEYVFTGKMFVQPGLGNATLVHFQLLFFIDESAVFDNPPPVNGVESLGLQELRIIACSPKKPKKRKKKIDDKGAYKGNEKGYKTRQDRRRKQLSEQRKKEIAEAVRTRVLTYADSSFIRALANADKIKTTKDAFNFALNVIPLRQMIQIGLDCTKKYINAAPEDIVCKTIMDNLENEQVVEILKYCNINATTDSVAGYFRQYIIGEFIKTTGYPVEADPSGFAGQFRQYMVEVFRDNVTNRQIICGIIYAALPAAIVLLALYLKKKTNLKEDGTCGDPLSPAGNKTLSLLENPAKDGLNAIKKALYTHPIIGYATNFTDNLYKQIIIFVDQVVTQSVAILLQELALLCEDSGKSDLANALTSEDVFSPGIDDIITSDLAFQDGVNFINGIIEASEENFDDCFDALADKSIIEDFFNDIPAILTPSEVCVLFNGDPASFNYNITLDKVFYGLLKIPKYDCLERAIQTRDKLIEFIDVFGEYVDEVACQNNIQEFIKNKKMVSDFCKSTDNAFVESLSKKADSGLVDQIINQEEELLNQLLRAIKNLAAPPVPELFCGPEAEESGKTPLLSTFQEESQLYLSKKFMTSVLETAEKFFESEVDNFKVILTNPINTINGTANGANLNKFFAAAGQIGNAMANRYNLDLRDEDGNPLPGSEEAVMLETLNNMTAQSKIVAPVLKTNLEGIQSNLILDVFNDKVFQLRSQNYGFGTMRYAFNYSDEKFIITNLPPNYDDDQKTILPKSSLLIFIPSPKPGQVEPDPITHTSLLTDQFDFTGLADLLFDVDNPLTNPINTDDNSQYLNFIKNSVNSVDFYANVVEQIIREHAEFMSTSDLFIKSFFNNLPLSKNNFCETSLFDYQDILDKMDDRTKKVECYTGIGKIPTPSEKVQLASVYEAMVRAVCAIEMMKSFFVFASFGMEGILPTITDEGENEMENSFYYDYLYSQVVSKIDQLIPEDKIEIVETAVEEAGSADKGLPKPTLGFSTIKKELIQGAITGLQKQVSLRLKKAGFKTKLTATWSGKNGVFIQEFNGGSNIKNNDVSIGNITKVKSFVNNIIPPETPVLSPPTVKSIGFAAGQQYFQNAIEIEPLYSTNPRLANGGFFIERGFEMINHREASFSGSPARSQSNAITAEEIDKLIDALPAYVKTGGEEELVVFENYQIVDYRLPYIGDGQLFGKDAEGKLILGPSRKFIKLFEPTQSQIADHAIAVFESLGYEYLVKLIDNDKFYAAYTIFNNWYSNIDSDNGTVSDSSEYLAIPLPSWLTLYTDELQESVQALEQNGYNVGEGLPDGTDSNNILNIFGRGLIDGELRPVTLQSSTAVQKLGFLQKYLFGGQRMDNSGKIASTIFSQDFPYGFNVSTGIPSDQKAFYNAQGKIPLSDENVFMFSEMYKNIDNFSTNLINGLKTGRTEGNAGQVKSTNLSTEQILHYLYSPSLGQYSVFDQHISYLESRMRNINTYFYKFGVYESLNVLIRVDQASVSSLIDGFIGEGGEGSLDVLLKLLNDNIENDFTSEEGKSNWSSFAYALLEKKFLIKDGDIIYFKLPIAYSYNDWVNGQSLQTNLSAVNYMSDDNPSNILPLLSSLQYENLLSFVATFVTNSLSYSYPSLEFLFGKTLSSLQAAMQNQLAIADRVNSQDYYEDSYEEQQLAQYRQGETHILALFFEGILQAVANTTDPTWRTPWLMPGPITPFGILAKLLSGEDDVGSIPLASELNQVPTKDVFDCEDE